MKRRPIYVLLALMLFLSLVGSACKKSEPKPTGTPTLVPTLTTVPPTVTPIPVTPTPLPDYTPPAAGSIPPYVLQRSPERGEELGIEQPIELIFDRPMDRSSVERAMVVSVDGGEALGRTEAGPGGTGDFGVDGTGLEHEIDGGGHEESLIFLAHPGVGIRADDLVINEDGAAAHALDRAGMAVEFVEGFTQDDGRAGIDDVLEHADDAHGERGNGRATDAGTPIAGHTWFDLVGGEGGKACGEASVSGAKGQNDPPEESGACHNVKPWFSS